MSDVFRQEYTPVSDEAKAKVKEFKVKAQELWDLIPKHDEIALSSEFSVAMSKLEEVVMWTTKGLTNPEGYPN